MPFFLRPLALLITGAVDSKYVRPNLKTHFDFLESQLATAPDGGGYLCGIDLTGADFMMSTPLGMWMFFFITRSLGPPIPARSFLRTLILEIFHPAWKLTIKRKKRKKKTKIKKIRKKNERKRENKSQNLQSRTQKPPTPHSAIHSTANT